MEFDVVIRRASDIVEDISEEVKHNIIKEEKPIVIEQDTLNIIEDNEDEYIEYEGLSEFGMAFGAEEEEEVIETAPVIVEPSTIESIPKSKMKFMTKTIIFSFVFVVLYTIWTQIAMVIWQIYPNDVVTEWVYKFFGLEVALLFGKKLFDTWIANRK